MSSALPEDEIEIEYLQLPASEVDARSPGTMMHVNTKPVAAFPVSLMDFAHEVLANCFSFACFCMPSTDVE